MLETQRWLLRGLMAITVIAIGAQMLAAMRGREVVDHTVYLPTVQTIEIPAQPVATPDSTDPCDSSEESIPLADWTIAQDHFGPLASCKSIDHAFVARVLPDDQVLDVPLEVDGMEVTSFVVKHRGSIVMTIIPNDANHKLAVVLESADVETPWRTRVGDTLHTLRAHQRDIRCGYNIESGRENLTCARSGLGGGWLDTLAYQLDLGSLGNDRSLFDEAYNDHLEKLDRLPITSIGWHPAR